MATAFSRIKVTNRYRTPLWKSEDGKESKFVLSDSAVSGTMYWYATLIARLVVHANFQELVFYSELMIRLGEMLCRQATPVCSSRQFSTLNKYLDSRYIGRLLNVKVTPFLLTVIIYSGRPKADHAFLSTDTTLRQQQSFP